MAVLRRVIIGCVLVVALADPQAFGEFAIEALKANVANLRAVVDLWHSYLHRGIPRGDIRQDAPTRLIIALLARQVPHSEVIVKADIEEIRS
jgi:hypothetical protein